MAHEHLEIGRTRKTPRTPNAKPVPNPFKVGDQVLCVEAANTLPPLVKGAAYTIRAVFGNGVDVEHAPGRIETYSWGRFEKTHTKIKTGD